MNGNALAAGYIARNEVGVFWFAALSKIVKNAAFSLYEDAVFFMRLEFCCFLCAFLGRDFFTLLKCVVPPVPLIPTVPSIPAAAACSSAFKASLSLKVGSFAMSQE